MKRFLKTNIAVISLAFIFSIFIVGEVNAQGPLPDVLKRMDNHNKALTSLKADLKMVKHDPVVDVTDTFEGAITFLPKTASGKYARIDWAKPKAESIAIRGETFESYVPSLKTITTGKTAGMTKGVSGGALSLLSMSKAQLQENYFIAYMGQEGISGSVQTFHLKLTPKTKNGYKSSDIWVDGDGMPLQVTDTQNNNSTTTILLTRVKKNETIEGSIFKINPPKGTKVVKG